MNVYKVVLRTVNPEGEKYPHHYKSKNIFVNGGIDEAILMAKMDFADTHNAEYKQQIGIGMMETVSIALIVEGDYC